MKKIMIILCLFISGCVYQKINHFDLFFAYTCPNCRLFKENIIPYLKEEYPDVVITTHNIDKEESLDLYAKTISLLKDYHADNHSGSVPLLVFDGCFVKFGYQYDEKELFLNNFKKAINGEEIEITQDYYLFEKGKSLY